MITGLILLIIGKQCKFMHNASGHSCIHLRNSSSHSHLLYIFRTPENQANSNDEICATNTQDNLENQFNANSGMTTMCKKVNLSREEIHQGSL
jgi:hypothetical protein